MKRNGSKRAAWNKEKHANYNPIPAVTGVRWLLPLAYTIVRAQRELEDTSTHFQMLGVSRCNNASKRKAGWHAEDPSSQPTLSLVMHKPAKEHGVGL